MTASLNPGAHPHLKKQACRCTLGQVHHCIRGLSDPKAGVIARDTAATKNCSRRSTSTTWIEFKMHHVTFILVVALALAAGQAIPVQARGSGCCGAHGHMAFRGVLGSAEGCAVGHHKAVKCNKPVSHQGGADQRQPSRTPRLIRTGRNVISIGAGLRPGLFSNLPILARLEIASSLPWRISDYKTGG